MSKLRKLVREANELERHTGDSAARNLVTRKEVKNLRKVCRTTSKVTDPKNLYDRPYEK